MLRDAMIHPQVSDCTRGVCQCFCKCRTQQTVYVGRMISVFLAHDTGSLDYLAGKASASGLLTQIRTSEYRLRQELASCGWLAGR